MHRRTQGMVESIFASLPIGFFCFRTFRSRWFLGLENAFLLAKKTSISRQKNTLGSWNKWGSVGPNSILTH